MRLRNILSALLLFAVLPAPAREKPNVWVRVRSPHFTVISNADAKQARHVAGQLERMRNVFHQALAGKPADPALPIIVLAARDEKTFRTLVPAAWLVKGQLQRVGMFIRAPEKNYVLLRLDAEGENPFASIYHEYTHTLMHRTDAAVPLWLDEGTADFYAHSKISPSDAELGLPSVDYVLLLRRTALLPLATLFAVEYSSPYYNEESKGSIFYAESWALTHLLMVRGFGQHPSPIQNFLTLLASNVEPMEAARRTFGDLTKLQKDLGNYVQQADFHFVRLKAATIVDENTFSAEVLAPAEALAVQGDFMVVNSRFDDARAVLRVALHDDPQNAGAATAMGYLELRENHFEEARRWFSQAVQLDARSTYALYYYATMLMESSKGGRPPDEVEKSLRTAIQIDPTFAPASSALATFYAQRGENLEEAERLGARAVELEPSIVAFRLNLAFVLLRMERPDDAIHVLESALKIAKTPAETEQVNTQLESARRFQEALANRRAPPPQNLGVSPPALRRRSEEISPPVLRRRSGESPPEQAEGTPAAPEKPPPARGPRDMLDGTITEVTCSRPAHMDLTLTSRAGTFHLHTEDYSKVEYSALGFEPAGELVPCTGLRGRPARVFFYDLKGRPNEGELISVELRK